MIPSGYKEDTVFSAIPSDGSGDLSFTRASNGTRVNSAGLVEVCPWNLFEYSEDFTNGYWSKVRSTATNNTTTAPNGTTTADTITCNDTGVNGCWVNSSLSLSTERTVSIYVKPNTCSYFQIHRDYGSGIVFNLNNGTIKSSLGGTGTITSVGDGWYYCTATFSTSGLIIYILGNSSMTVTSWASTNNENLYLWGAQLNIGSTAKPYFPTTDRLNVPRLTYQNGGCGCPSLLLEKQSTNLAWPSENLTGWTSGGMTNSTNQTISPDGTQNGGKSTIGSTTRYYDVTTNGITTVNGTTYTTSFFAKKGTGIESIYFYQGDGGRIAKWNLNNGAYIGYAPADGYNAFASYGSESLGNGWYRFYATYTASSTSGNLTIGVSTNTNDSVTPISGNGTDFVYVWGLQYEASSYPTSYIPTTSSSATRVADACFKTGISSLIGQTEGVLFMDFVAQPTPTAQSHFWIGVAGNEIGLYGNTQFIFYSSGGVSINGGSIVAGTRYKVAFAYKANDYVVYINGTQVGTDTSATVPTTSALYINSYSDFTEIQNKQVNEFVLFPTRLTNAELASLTTI
jgi:hypothetical protein